MIRPDDQAQQMRHHQTDEADQPRRRHCGTDAQRGAQHQLDLQPLDVEAEMTGLRLAQQQGIQRIDPARQPAGHQQGDQQQRPESWIAGAIEAAQVPEGQGTQGRVIGQVGKQADQRAGQGGQCDTGEKHGRHAGLAVVAAKTIDQPGHAQTAAEGAGREQVRRERLRQTTESSAEDDSHRRA
ncbi:hypothetical protein D3C80_1538350 [compost metagenome]